MKLILLLEYPLYEAFIKEQKLIVEFAKYKYKPIIKFDGWTECFYANIKENIINSVGPLAA